MKIRIKLKKKRLQDGKRQKMNNSTTAEATN